MCHYFSFVVAAHKGGLVVLSEPELSEHDAIRVKYSKIYNSVDGGLSGVWCECEWIDGMDLEIRSMTDSVEDIVRNFVNTSWHSREAIVRRVCIDMLNEGVIPSVNRILRDTATLRDIICKVILFRLKNYTLKTMKKDEIKYLKEVAKEMVANNFSFGDYDKLFSLYVDHDYPEDRIPFAMKQITINPNSRYIPPVFKEIINGVMKSVPPRSRKLRKYTADLIIEAIRKSTNEDAVAADA